MARCPTPVALLTSHRNAYGANSTSDEGQIEAPSRSATSGVGTRCEVPGSALIR